MVADIFNEEQTFFDEFDGFCYQNCLMQILEYYNVKNPELYINNSLTTVMYKESNADYKIGYDNNSHGITPLCSHKVRRYDESKSSIEVWNHNIENIKKNIPIIVCVDGFYLDYLPYYEKQHCRHNLILVGSNEKMQTAQIIDWYKPWLYKGEINLKHFLSARDSENEFDGGVYSGIPIRNNWAIVDKEGWEYDIEELIKINLEISKNQYFNDESNNGILRGVNVVKEIVNILNVISDMESHNIKKELFKLHSELYSSVKRKEFFLFFLTRVYIINNIEKYQISCNYLRDLINDWNKFMFMLLKCSYTGKKDKVLSLITKIKDIIRKEEGLYDYIINL